MRHHLSRSVIALLILAISTSAQALDCDQERNQVLQRRQFLSSGIAPVVTPIEQENIQALEGITSENLSQVAESLRQLGSANEEARVRYENVKLVMRLKDAKENLARIDGLIDRAQASQTDMIERSDLKFEIGILEQQIDRSVLPSGLSERSSLSALNRQLTQDESSLKAVQASSMQTLFPNGEMTRGHLNVNALPNGGYQLIAMDGARVVRPIDDQNFELCNRKLNLEVPIPAPVQLYMPNNGFEVCTRFTLDDSGVNVSNSETRWFGAPENQMSYEINHTQARVREYRKPFWYSSSMGQERLSLDQLRSNAAGILSNYPRNVAQNQFVLGRSPFSTAREFAQGIENGEYNELIESALLQGVGVMSYSPTVYYNPIGMDLAGPQCRHILEEDDATLAARANDNIQDERDYLRVGSGEEQVSPEETQQDQSDEI